MGLSNEQVSAQKKLETYQVILDVAKSIKELAARPDFESLSKLAYSLPENDQKKADEGRAIISELDAKIDEQKKREAALQDEQDNIDKRSQEITDALRVIDEKNNKLASREDAVSRREDALTVREKTADERDKSLSDRERKLADGIDQLKSDRTDFDDMQAKARQRAEEIKKLSEGL